jgi:hypothetical protein
MASAEYERRIDRARDRIAEGWLVERAVQAYDVELQDLISTDRTISGPPQAAPRHPRPDTAAPASNGEQNFRTAGLVFVLKVFGRIGDWFRRNR